MIAALASLNGLRPGAKAGLVDSLKLLDRNIYDQVWQQGLRMAGPGPEQFQSLRAYVQHRVPYPARGFGGP